MILNNTPPPYLNWNCCNFCTSWIIYNVRFNINDNVEDVYKLVEVDNVVVENEYN